MGDECGRGAGAELDDMPMIRRPGIRRASALGCGLLASVTLLAAGFAKAEEAPSPRSGAVRKQFQHPPKAYRPMVRWWWPGDDVGDAELRREVAELDAAGFGGAEIQAMFANMGPLTPERRSHVFSFGTAGFFGHVRAAVDEARGRGMWMDLTFASGWPFGGGEAITPEFAGTKLVYADVAAKGGEHVHQKLALPQVQSSPVGGFVHTTLGDPILPNPPGWDDRLKARAKLVAVLAFRTQPPQTEALAAPTLAGATAVKASGRIDLTSRVDLTGRMQADGTLDWQVPPGEWRIFAFRQIAMSDQVMGGAWPGPELILDHLNKAAFDAYAKQLGDPLTSVLSDRFGNGLRAIFCDNIEIPADLYWSEDFPSEFQKRRGYSLVPYLPLIIQTAYVNAYNPMTGMPLYDAGDAGPKIRRDYWRTVSELLTERFYQSFADWGARRHLLTRLQAHVSPTDLLHTYALASIPETETLGYGGLFDFMKVASSAGDIYGRKIVSAESFDNGGDPYATTPETLKQTTDKLIITGVNQIVYHGFPYAYDDRPFPGWSPFNTGTATSFGAFMNSRNTFWPYIPRINAYITRLQYISQTGTTVNPVAVLNTRLGYDNTAIGYDSTRGDDPPVIKALVKGGYGFDHINFDAVTTGRIEGGELVTVGGARFRAIVIDDSAWLDSAVAAVLAKAARSGVAVVFVGRLPAEGEGFKNSAAESRKVRDAVAAAETSPRARHVATDDEMIAALDALTPPNVRFLDGSALPFIEKKLGALDAFFFNNPQSDPVRVEAEVSASGSPELWDPWTGTTAPYGDFQVGGTGKRITLSLPAHGSALLVFDPADHHGPMAASPSQPPAAAPPTPPSGPWEFRAVGRGADGSEVSVSRTLPQLIDWAKDEQLKGFSGRGTYTIHISIPADALKKAGHVWLDLGVVRDVAEVRINDVDAPALLMAPYAVDIADRVRPGENLVEITVVNTLTNSTGRRPPVFPNAPPGLQSAKSFVPRPGGLLGPVTLRFQ